MNHRTRALVGLLCIAGLASGQLNQGYRPEFFSPGQGFQSVSAQISSNNYGGTTVTKTQERADGGITSKVITTGTITRPFYKQTTVTSDGYNYPVPDTIPCYEPNKLCAPNQYCNDGFVDESQLNLFNTNNQNCNSATEQCCRIRPMPATRCPDDTYVCVSPSLCNNGLLNFDAQNAISTQQPTGECYAPEVCCKQQSLLSQSTVLTNEGYVVKDEITNPANETPVVLRPNTPRPFQPPRPQEPQGPAPLPPVGCSAAMNCTEEEYCSSTGVISKTPVVLTEEQKLFRVPVTSCRNLERGFTGVCCRDPDYVDPWPVGQLGQYNPEILGFDDGSYRPDRPNGNGNGNGNGLGNGNGNGRRPGEPIQAAPSQSTVGQRINSPAPSGLQFTNSGNTRFRPFQNQRSDNSFPKTQQTCAPRNYNTQPRGAGPLGTGFGEFPWQAMVLFEPNKTLLCGGAIISDNTVVTAANCVYGLNPRTIQIKGGEWRLGVDAEPKTFQIVRVKDVVYHPAYNPTTLNYDVAMLVLEDRLRFDTHIGAICLDENDVVPSASYENCVTTGWGKEVLKIHISNALMQQMPISLLSEAESQSQLQANGFSPESHICGRPSGDACEVDVGSALACADTSGTYYLKGVYSADNGCNRPDQIVSFSNIDVQWIKQALKNPNQFITPVPNYQTAANSPTVTRVQLQSTQGPVYSNKYLPPI
uniref:Peptidase S1 domain-containing protein n=1 Tax=Anopheles atroparvus TaxID=41427 RepID=A0AAG5DIH9_ANOAO